MHHLFRNADFRRLFLGRVVTNAGDSLYSVAAMWLVYSLTGSTFFTGLAGFLTLGMQALQAFVGPLVDRWPLRRTLLLTQAAQGVLVLVIPAAHFLGVLTVWLVLTVMPLVSLLNQFVYPAGTAALPRIVDEEDLTAANSLFAMTYQGAELVFNALAGLLVVAVGAVALFAVDSLTFAVAVALFAGLRVPTATTEADRTGYLTELREGFSFVRGSVVVWLFGASVVANGLLGATVAVLPAFAELRGGPELYGFLLAGLAAGTLAGTLVAGRFEAVPFGRLGVVGYTLSALAWVAALLAPSPAFTVALFALAFVPVGVTNVVAVTLFQRLVPDALLGRVMAVLGSAGTAVMPLGALIGGAAGEFYGPVAVMYAGGVGFLWIVAYILAVPALRRFPAATAVEPLSRASPQAD
jgi:MFS family permease